MKLNEATFFRVSSSMKANKQARAFIDEGNGRGPIFYVGGPNFTEEGAPPVPGALSPQKYFVVEDARLISWRSTPPTPSS